VDEPGTIARRLGVGLAVGALAGSLARDLDLLAAASFWGDRLVMVVAGAAVGALLWATRLRPLVAAAAGGLGLLWLAAAYTPLSARLAAGLVRADPPGPAEAVLVLSSRLQQDGEPTPESASRLLRGLELLADGQATTLVLTEKPAPLARYEPLARAFMQRFGLRQELLTVGPVETTRDEALAAARLCRERGWKRLLVVTSPTHTRRACATVESEGIEVVCVPAVEVRFDLENLDRPQDRMTLFGQVLHERAGYWVYVRRGWIVRRQGGAAIAPP
jgi:uncharacterized SAM-binding protein YcdF (DUF218 family)